MQILIKKICLLKKYCIFAVNFNASAMLKRYILFSSSIGCIVPAYNSHLALARNVAGASCFILNGEAVTEREHHSFIHPTLGRTHNKEINGTRRRVECVDL